MSRFSDTLKKAVIYCALLFSGSLLVLMYTPIANMLASMLVVQGSNEKADLIVVLGGGAYPNNTLNGASMERFLNGIILYKQGLAPKVLFSGATILNSARKLKNTLENGDEPADVTESIIMREISLKLGIPADDFAIDAGSRNTKENLENAKEHMRAKGYKTCLIVTSSTHMKRALLVSKKLGMECYPAPVADNTVYRTGPADRLSLLRESLWEFLGLTIYKYYGYI